MMKTAHYVSGLKRRVQLGDMLLINLSYILAHFLRFGMISFASLRAYLVLSPVITLFALSLFHFYKLYNSKHQSWSEIMAGLIAVVGVGIILTTALTFMTQGYGIPRLVLVFTPLIQLPFLTLWRRYWHLWTKKNVPLQKAIAICKDEKTASLLTAMNRGWYRAYALVSDTTKVFDNLTVYPFEALEEALKEDPEVVVLHCSVPTPVKEKALQRSLESDWELFLVPDLYEILIRTSKLDHIGQFPALSARLTPDPETAWVKRFFDLSISGLLLLLILPLLPLIALAIRLDSKGPVIYRQERVGLEDKPFTLYKFRTMEQHAEKTTGPTLSSSCDPRVTRVGKILRPLRLDELPQLVNILKGDMSLVGPRPERDVFVRKYQESIEHYPFRHKLKGGLTGLAQVSGSYSTPAEEKLIYDLLYAGSASLLLDLRILLQTIQTLLVKDRSN